MQCPNCGSEVEQGAAQCAQCEVAIAWDGDTATFEMPVDDQPVFVATDPSTLPVIKSLLEMNEIPYIVTDDVSQDMLGWGRFIVGFNPVTGPPVVKVPAEHAEAARELIASARRSVEDSAPE